MSYRIAGIDVHKKMLAVVVSDVEVDGEYQFERRHVWQQPRTTAIAGRLAARARGRGSSDGIDGAILETSVGSTGTVLEADYARSEKAQAGSRERCIWRRRNPIAGGGDARRISPMPNDW